MKTEAKKQIKEKEFDTVKTFRAIKEKISKDIADMNLEQIKAYLENKKVRLQD
jgi:CO dehydrogenase/acetyl-CoA synthase epsilon subunit